MLPVINVKSIIWAGMNCIPEFDDEPQTKIKSLNGQEFKTLTSSIKLYKLHDPLFPGCALL